MIYLASPYSSSEPGVMQLRYEQTLEATALLLAQGLPVFSPIVHCHEAAQKFSLPTDFHFWNSYCLDLLSHASRLWVLALDGYTSSFGVAAEIAHWRKLNRNFIYIYPEELFGGKDYRHVNV